MKKILIVGFALATLSLYAGCVAQHPRPSISEIGTAKHHVNSGMKLLDKGKIPDAMWQFDRAIDLDRTIAMGYVGRAMTYLAKNDLGRCKANLEFARSFARGDEDRINVNIGYMRFYSEQKKKGWLDDVKLEFEQALEIDSRYKATYFFMGMAYKEAFDFKSAERMFERVLEINDPFLIRADTQWKLVRKILTARPESHAAKTAALKSRLTRAQLASILVKELEAETLHKDYFIQKSRSVGAFPDKVPDIQEHVLKADIETVLKLDLDGISLMEDNLFHPDNFVTRADLAAVVEDLMKKTGEDIQRWKPKVTTSPFHDVDTDHKRFRAILYCVTKGFMNVNNIATEEFAPNLPVSGSDTILTLRKVRDHLRYR